MQEQNHIVLPPLDNSESWCGPAQTRTRRMQPPLPFLVAREAGSWERLEANLLTLFNAFDHHRSPSARMTGGSATLEAIHPCACRHKMHRRAVARFFSARPLTSMSRDPTESICLARGDRHNIEVSPTALHLQLLRQEVPENFCWRCCSICEPKPQGGVQPIGLGSPSASIFIRAAPA